MGALISLFAVVFLVGFPVIAIVALVKARRASAGLSQTRASVAALSSRLDDFLAEREPPDAEPVSDQTPEEAEAVEGGEEAEEAEEIEEAEEDLDPWNRRPRSQPAAPAPARTGFAASRFEEAVMSRWLVWLGAATIGLGGIFLVRYAVERGQLGPAARTSIGLAVGIALVIGGEWLRRRPVQRAIAAIRADYVPPALTASGLFVAFASIYVAHAVHDLIAPMVAFVLLAAIALIGVALALVQGWFVALLGLLGAFLAPALAPSADPLAWALFPYLLIIAAACLAVARRVEAWWLALATLLGVVAWPIAWLATSWSAPDVIPIGLYLVLSAAAFVATAPPAVQPAEPAAGWRAELRSLPPGAIVAGAAPCALAIVVFALVQMDSYATPSLVFLGLYVGLLLLLGWRDARFDGLAVVSLALVLAVMAAWHLPGLITGAEPLYRIEGMAYGAIPGPIVPPELARFATVELLFAALFAGAGFAVTWRARRPALWAGVSAGAPVFLLVIAYWRIVGFGVDLAWATVALALAAVSLLAAARLQARRSERELAAAVGFHAAAVVALVSLGAAMTLREAWLAVVLALQLPALGWIANRVPSDALRKIAMIVAAIVVARLALNIQVLDYSLPAAPLFGWVLYGYSIPAIACWSAARLFRRAANDALVVLLEAAALGFAALLVTPEIRLAVEGTLASTHYDLFEQSLQTIAWLSIAYGLAVADRKSPHLVWHWAWRGLLCLALAQVVLLQLVHSSPLSRVTYVGALPVVNLLLLAYAIPALFCFGFMREQTLRGAKTAAGLLGALGLVLVFAYLSFEVRRAFQGATLLPIAPTDVELYVYSVVWLVYSGVLLGGAILRRVVGLRYASFVFLLITIVKVFLVDMADLTDLLRVASFIGLGLSLVAVGFVYQRFVFTPPPAPAAPS